MRIRTNIMKILFLLFLCIAAVIPVAAGAAEVPCIEPRFTGIEEQAAQLSINAVGKASCVCSVLASTGYTLETTMALERDGYAIKTWSGSGTLVELDKTHYVSSGFEYQVVVESKVKTSGGTYLYTYTLETQIEEY